MSNAEKIKVKIALANKIYDMEVGDEQEIIYKGEFRRFKRTQ